MKKTFFAFVLDKNEDEEDYMKFVEDIHYFNLKTRCFSFRKKKMDAHPKPALAKKAKKSKENLVGKNKVEVSEMV